MEAKQLVVLEITKGESVFTFSMPLGATWGTAIDASYELLQELHKMSKEAADKMKPAEPQEKGE